LVRVKVSSGKQKSKIQISKLGRFWLYGGLIVFGLSVVSLSIYQASVRGFYRQINLGGSDEDYINQVDRRGLSERLNKKEKECWRSRRRDEKEKLKCGVSWLVEGKAKEGVYELIKGMRQLEVKMEHGDCSWVEWQETRVLIKQVLGLVGGGIHEAIAKEFELLKETGKKRCGW